MTIMALLVKPSNAGLGSFEYFGGKSFLRLESSSPIQVQSWSWRECPQRYCERLSAKEMCAKFGVGGPQRKIAIRSPLKPTALPVDRGRQIDTDDTSEPWLGAVVFKRSSLRNHYEFETSLERLGMGYLSSEATRALANSMGIKSTLDDCTGVQISIDVAREAETQDIRLEGIARTSINLCCNRCLTPVEERLFADFSLLLSEKPVVEPTQQRIGVVLGESGYDKDRPTLDIELDDKLHFPKEMKELDLSKYVRDTIHLGIPYRSLCSGNCLGLCLICGKNLNKEKCACKNGDATNVDSKDENNKASWGLLDQLKTQLEDERQADQGNGSDYN